MYVLFYFRFLFLIHLVLVNKNNTDLSHIDTICGNLRNDLVWTEPLKNFKSV